MLAAPRAARLQAEGVAALAVLSEAGPRRVALEGGVEAVVAAAATFPSSLAVLTAACRALAAIGRYFRPGDEARPRSQGVWGVAL